MGSIKRGDTFAFNITLSDAGLPVTGAAAKLRCQVRRGATAKDALLAELTVTERPDLLGTYVFSLAGTTRDWPSKVFLDVEYTNAGVIRSTETLSVKIEEDVTNA